MKIRLCLEEHEKVKEIKENIENNLKEANDLVTELSLKYNLNTEDVIDLLR